MHGVITVSSLRIVEKKTDEIKSQKNYQKKNIDLIYLTVYTGSCKQ